MTRSRRQFLCSLTAFACVCPLRAATQPRREISISCDPIETIGDYGRGVELGAHEAERLATLLDYRFQLVHSGPAMAALAVQARPTAIPMVAMRGTSEADCVFITASTEADHAAAKTTAGGRQIVDWHPAFRRYGASELNERYEKMFARPMTADAWHGWVAIKALIEAAIRGDICAELGRLRFDGHKGRALSFDPSTRRLRHPLLAVTRDGGREVVEALP